MKNLAPSQVFLLNRASQDQRYLAYTLLTYLKASGKEWPDLLTDLGCDEQHLLKLALCRNLHTIESNFSEQLQQIASYVNIDAVVLSDIIKRSAFLSVLRPEKNLSSVFRNTFLAAAREKDAKEDLPPENRK